MRFWLALWMLTLCLPGWGQSSFGWESADHRFQLVDLELHSGLFSQGGDHKPPELRLKLVGGWEMKFPETHLEAPPQVLLNGGSLLHLGSVRFSWDRTTQLVLLDRRGKAVWRTSQPRPGTPWRYDWTGDPDSRYLSNWAERSWLSRDEKQLWLLAQGSLIVVDTATGHQLEARDYLGREFSNPAAPSGQLLVAASHLGINPPRAYLLAGQDWLRQGWLARLGDKVAAARLEKAAFNRDPLALEGLALMGPARVRPALLLAMRFNAPWRQALELLGKSGEPILLEALRRMPAESEALGNLADKAAWSSNPDFWEPLLRLSYSSTEALESLVWLHLPDQSQRLRLLLDDSRLPDKPILEYFQRYSFKPVNSSLIKLLRSPSSDAHEVLKALRFQNRVDFGLDAAAWERWTQASPTRSADEKAHILDELNEPAALLWMAHAGSLKLERLQRLPRVQAIWPVQAALAPDGNKLLAAGDVWQTLHWEFADGVCAWDPRTGKGLPLQGGEAQVRVLQSPAGYAMFERPNNLRVRSGSGRVVELPSRACKISGSGSAAILYAYDDAVFDATTWRLYPLPIWGGSSVMSPVNPEVAAMDKDGLKIWDWRESRMLVDTLVPWQPRFAPSDAPRFSQNGERLLLSEGEPHLVYDRSGRLVHRGNQTALAISPDGRELVVVDQHRLRTVGIDSNVVSAPGIYCAEECNATYLPDSANFLVGGAHGPWSLSLFQGDLSRPVRFWGPKTIRGFAPGQFSACDGPVAQTWIWQQGSGVPGVPAHHQTLLCELWTGMHLQAGMATPLTPEQYQQRVRRWGQEGGGSWYLDPQSLPESEGGLLWLVSLPLVLGLLVQLRRLRAH